MPTDDAADGAGEDYQHLLVTEEFAKSLTGADPALRDADIDGILQALDDLDAEPTSLRNRLHVLDRELTGWWSLTPPEPADQSVRILIRPEQRGPGGIWRVGPITWHYRR